MGLSMNIWAILLAAGQSSRLASQGFSLPKQFLNHGDAPLFWHSARTFSRIPAIRGIVFVFPGTFPVFSQSCLPGLPDEKRFAEEDALASYEMLIGALAERDRLGLPWQIAFGGERRQDSVANGLELLPVACDAVLIHDSARPFASAVLVQSVIAALEEGNEAVIPGIPVIDTIKSVDACGQVVETHERVNLRAVQTPQGFLLRSLRQAHATARESGWEVTDDASLMERCGRSVLVVPGEEGNGKITTMRDLSFLKNSSDRENSGTSSALVPCSGFGYDVHRYGGNRPFILGGVPIACEQQVCAHSDGDTLLHALIDALLGCIGGGDIGTIFPDTDPAFDNISSGILLSEVLERCRLAGLVITNVDITVIAQTPRLSPHKESIGANLAKLLQISRRAVNVKATTEEGLGFTGEKKGIKVAALVSGLRPAVV